MERTAFTAYRDKVVTNCARVIVGKDDIIEKVLVSFLCGGHVLLEDKPGTGKTRLARTTAHTIGSTFGRIQFTPDLLPSDVLGVTLYDQSTGTFSWRKGPVFASLVLADEINRTSPKTQSSLLEVMEDRPIQYVYPLEMPLKQKVEAIAKKIYRADGVNFSAAASKTLAELTELGYGDLPVCIAKTQYSFSDNAKLTGAPTGFTMEVREVRLAAGAGFVVVICGNIMTMPGLPKKPAAVNIDVDAEGKITGLF